MQISSENPSFKALNFVCMLYITLILAANILVFRMTLIGSLTVSIGVYIIPFWFVLADIIAEVYGYKICKRIIWFCLICNLIFGTICSLSIYFPYPISWHYSADYQFIVAKQIKVALLLLIAVIAGGFLNAYLISKWKIILRGRYFWLRCLGASFIGQLIFSLVTIGFNFYSVLPLHDLLVYIVFAYLQKMLSTTFLAVPAVYIARMLKRIENIDTYDQQLKFNPFTQ